MTREQSADVTSATVKRSVQRQPKEQQPRSSKSKVVCATEAGLAVDMLPLRPNRVSLAARNLNIRKPLQELSWPRCGVEASDFIDQKFGFAYVLSADSAVGTLTCSLTAAAQTRNAAVKSGGSTKFLDTVRKPSIA